MFRARLEGWLEVIIAVKNKWIQTQVPWLSVPCYFCNKWELLVLNIPRGRTDWILVLRRIQVKKCMLHKMWQAPHSWHTLPISHRILYCLSWIWLQNPLNSVLWGANTKRSEQTHDFKLIFIDKRIHRAYSRKLAGSEVETANDYQYPIPMSTSFLLGTFSWLACTWSQMILSSGQRTMNRNGQSIYFSCLLSDSGDAESFEDCWVIRWMEVGFLSSWIKALDTYTNLP